MSACREFRYLLAIVAIARAFSAMSAESIADKARTVLAAQCVECHRPDKSRGNLDLTTRTALMKGGKSGATVISGKSKESLLYKMVAHLEEPFMPDKSDKLPAATIQLLADWIDAGAPYDKPIPYTPKRGDATHWAFQPLSKATPPVVKDTAWIKTPVDTFVRAAQEAKQLTPTSAASKQRLVRRLYFDLIGLPPTPAEIDAFINDAAPDAYEKLVDTLLESPHYGERWGRHWLDLARYADSMGYRFDDNTYGAYHYRDFVIRAFNADMPYDQFVRWQLAGDELAPGERDARAATGFLAVGPRERDEGDALNRKNIRYNELDDLVSTTCSSMLGLTMACARCHDHKFDPISQKEYYQTLTAFIHGQRSELPMGTAADEQARMQWQEKNNALDSAVTEWFERNAATLNPFMSESQKKIDEIENTLRTKAKLKKPQADLDELFYKRYANTEFTSLPDFGKLKPDASGEQSPPRIDLEPAAGKPRFGLVYSGFLKVPDNGKYTFHLTTDDLARVMIGDKRVVEADGLNGLETRSESIELTKGRVSIHVEYVQGEHGSVLKLEWEGPGVAKRSLSAVKKDTAFEKQLEKRGEELLGKETVRTYHALTKKVLSFRKDPLQDDTIKAALSPDAITEWNGISKKRGELNRAAPPPQQVCLGYSEKSAAPAKSVLLTRGLIDQPGDEVQLGFLNVLTSPQYVPPPSPAKAGSTFQRAALAVWMTDVDKGGGRLLARVLANRLWFYHFGEGLSRTPNDFGTQGDKPALPELLDWLAGQLIANGWRLKPVHRSILLSSTYRQDTAANAENAKIDPENRLWWRRIPVRNEAEILRDSVLSVSGVLNSTMFGPSVMVPIPSELIITKTVGKGNYPKGIKDGPDVWRRSVYVFQKRTVPVPITTLFDGPDSSGSCGRREQTTVAPQALLLMNDESIRARSRDFASRVMKLAGTGKEKQIDAAFRLALGRLPTPSEKTNAEKFLDAQSKLRDNNPTLALADFCQVLFGLNEFLYIN
ncbi:MAG: DUF1549 domain-containing protein [Planctomycetota bacterium]